MWPLKGQSPKPAAPLVDRAAGCVRHREAGYDLGLCPILRGKLVFVSLTLSICNSSSSSTAQLLW